MSNVVNRDIQQKFFYEKRVKIQQSKALKIPKFLEEWSLLVRYCNAISFIDIELRNSPIHFEIISPVPNIEAEHIKRTTTQHNILPICSNGVKKHMHVSTCEVLGTLKDSRFRELHEIRWKKPIYSIWEISFLFINKYAFNHNKCI